MSRYQSLRIKKVVLILTAVGLITIINISEAETQQEYLKLAQGGYRKVTPLNVSPKPDVIQDKEFLEGEKPDAEKKELLKTEEKELLPVAEKPTLVGREPTKLYYRIAVNDKIYISVWRAPDLSLEFIVGPDGNISFPLIGDIRAAGRTLSDLDAEITEKLKEYVENPQVSVIIREFAGDRVTVIGEIKSPGIYKFVGKTNIINVVALSGGFTDRAKVTSIVIVRETGNPENDTELIVVDAKNILKGNLSGNIEIKPNDIIYVSRTFVSNVKEFYDNWIIPVIDTAIDYESYKSIRRTRHR